MSFDKIYFPASMRGNESAELYGGNEKMDSEVFKNMLRGLFKKEEDYKAFVSNLKENKAIIAGGGVLSAYAGYPLNDLDIYMKISNGYKFIENMNKIEKLKFGYSQYDKTEGTLAPAYDQSFFRKNNILGRFRLRLLTSVNSRKFVDLMFIPDDIEPVSVVKNFDLSFCETWFDGENVYAVDPKGIKEKKGKLKKDYQDSLFKHFNRFIIQRIKKYKQRGFKIDIGSPSPDKLFDDYIKLGYEKENEELSVIKKIVSEEEWVVKTIYKHFLTGYSIIDMFTKKHYIYTFCEFPLTKFTMENLKKVFKDFKDKYNVPIPVDGLIMLSMTHLLVKDWYDHKWKSYIFDISKVSESELEEFRKKIHYPNSLGEYLESLKEKSPDPAKAFEEYDWESGDDQFLPKLVGIELLE